MKKNDKYIVDIIDMGMDGEGIAKVDGQIVFVPYAIMGEKVEILIIKTKSKFAIGKVVSVVDPSPIRIEAQCPYFSKCGGCDIQHIKYTEQLKLKKDSLTNTLKRIGGISHKVQDTISSENQFNYRNKVALPVVYQNGATIIGMYRRSTHNVVEISDCLIQMPFVKVLLEVTNKYITDNNIMGYVEESGKGLLRHIVARCDNNNLLVTLVATSKDLPNLNSYYNELSKHFDNVGLNININNRNTNVIMGSKTIYVAGIKELAITENNITYSVPNDSFLQVNNDIRNKIYNYVLDNIDGSDIIVDLYSGAGVLTSMLSKKANHVYGIEIVEAAVNSANNLIKNNNINNVTNICGDAFVELKKLSTSLNGNYSIVVDPPRKGLGDEVVELLLSTNASKIIYISCNPATLSRDLAGLSNKYNILTITPFDMFPQTKHLETVVCLSRK